TLTSLANLEWRDPEGSSRPQMLQEAGLTRRSSPQLFMDNGSAPSSRSVNSGLFVEEMSQVAMRFPVQHTELWRRSQIHLQKHLDTPHPTEPVSLVLTAGLKAKKTLHCLALNIASAFSSAVNTSVVVIDGESQANLDSDQVKMNIDSQLKEAFGSDKLAAVVHRFELLPPGSTLIFYRYCDHETAAYKRAFLLFTVLLSVEDLSTQQSLKEVEEMVRDHVEERFVGNETAFNEMDADKFSGLWSRIAHLILPVVYENETEQRGC
uniref:Torsin-1A-interacting protein 1/2 AAA+ activator domain-containing protein n=1 Tax=Periophthalmus magnuspinnatus TaxID=409849 RepID=A0A3B4ASP0_9GOBI